jgi:hypothetical protein
MTTAKFLLTAFGDDEVLEDRIDDHGHAQPHWSPP